MSDARLSLLSRFGGESAREPPACMRRRRLNLRLPDETLAKLRRIRIAQGIDQNAFCATVLIPAVDKAHDQLRERYDDAGWEIITRCADRKR